MNRADRIAFIGDQRADIHLLLADAGQKAVNLARLDRLGLRVPPALVLDAALSQEYRERGALPAGFKVRLAAALRYLEDATGLTFGGRRPLLLAVRSSPVIGMPGVLDTVLNVGLNDEGVKHLVSTTGNPWFAWDCYRRLTRQFGETVHRLEPELFDRVTTTYLARAGATAVVDLDPLSMRELACASSGLLRTAARPLPDIPMEQLVAAIEAVLASWNSARAQEYRRICSIDERIGAAIVIQAMAFGNAGGRSGSGFGCTRNPSTGDDQLNVDFVFNGQGDDVASGRHAVHDGARLAGLMPKLWADLQLARPVLEREFGDMQEFEFTVADGQLSFLQTRSAKRSLWAAVRVAVDLVRAGIVDAADALRRLEPHDLSAIVRRSVPPSAGRPLALAVSASPGVATGAVVFDRARAQALSAERPVILVRPEISTTDLAGIAAASGVLTSLGGCTSHGAVVARQLGKVCVVGCSELHVDERDRSCRLAGSVFHEGEVITVDGTNGAVFAGVTDVVVDRPEEAISLIEEWRAHKNGGAVHNRVA